MTIQESFERWIADNPKAEEQFVALARKARAAGFDHYGIKAMVEVVRFHFSIERRAGRFAIDNRHTSRLARYLDAKYPDLTGFFEFRRLTAE